MPQQQPRRITVSTAAPITRDSRDTGEVSRIHYRTALAAGVLDEAAEAAFTRGQCHSAAAALAEQPDWGQVVVVVERDTYPKGGHADTILHCYAVTPDGTWADVHGEHDPEGAVAAWQDSAAAPLFDTGHVHIVTIVTDAAGARSLTTRAGCQALGINSEVTLLPTSMRLARSVLPAVRERLNHRTA